MDKNRLLKTVSGAAGAALMLLALLPWAIEYLPGLAGIGCYGIHGGSMETALYDGDLVYAQDTDPAELEAGDVAVFRDWSDAGSFVAHRVLENFPDRGILVTKGDANGSPDALPVPYGSVAGRMSFRIPGGGRLVSAATTGSGGCATLFLVGAGAMLVVMSLAAGGKRRRGI